MKTFLIDLKYYFNAIALISGAAVAFYGVIRWGELAALTVAFSALLISAILKRYLRMKAKKEKPTFQLSLKQNDPCSLGECEPGFLFAADGTFCYKNEYDETFIVSSGEMFWGGTHTKESRDALMVIPLTKDEELI